MNLVCLKLFHQVYLNSWHNKGQRCMQHASPSYCRSPEAQGNIFP